MGLSPINPSPSPIWDLWDSVSKFERYGCFRDGEILERYSRGMDGEISGKILHKVTRGRTRPSSGKDLTMSTMLCILVIIPAGQGN